QRRPPSSRRMSPNSPSDRSGSNCIASAPSNQRQQRINQLAARESEYDSVSQSAAIRCVDALARARGRQCVCCRPSSAPQSLRGIERGGNDALVAGAAAEVAGDRHAYLLLGWIGIVAQEFGERDQHARRAEAALQAMVVAKRLLQRAQLGRAW